VIKLRSLKCNGFKRLKISEGINFSDGHLLIHGRNESGKSTVMEAIHYGLYGLALRPSKNASNDDLINYGYPQAVIELSFTIDDNEYQVKRVIKKQGTNIHELIINRSNSRRERITGARAVNSQILEELHGIDSDALLNSCLVEQKELGKLEEAVRSKRIEAMTSLLNLEAFFLASQEIRTNTNQLERTNQVTSLKLNKAEQAKRDYEEAEDKKNWAFHRIQEIEKELIKTKDRIKELDEILEIIEKIKTLNRVIENKTQKRNGLLGESKRIEKSLQDAKNAQIQILEIQKELPDAKDKLTQIITRYTALEGLLRVNSDLQNARGEKKRAIERLKDAKNKVKQAQEAKDKLLTVEEKINIYNQAETAQFLLPRIEKVVYDISDSNSEINRISQEKINISKRLDDLQSVEEQLIQLESKKIT
jgi:DNA repair exonuclease SbcCD ATPase subunit